MYNNHDTCFIISFPFLYLCCQCIYDDEYDDDEPSLVNDN